MLRVLDLFSGVGGFSLGLERTGGFKTVAFCEIEPFPRAVLAKHWPGVPCFDDVRKLTAHDVGAIDVICGGFPCQPVSSAGKRLGKNDDRWLWPQYRRLIEECRPSWVLGENVAGLVGMELDSVLADLEGLGYSVRPFDIPACAVGARHERRRIWIVAHAERGDAQELGIRPGEVSSQSFEASDRPLHGGDFGVGWAIESRVLRSGDGVPNGSHRLKALGNAVVPQIPEIIGRAILEAEGLSVS